MNEIIDGHTVYASVLKKYEFQIENYGAAYKSGLFPNVLIYLSRRMWQPNAKKPIPWKARVHGLGKTKVTSDLNELDVILGSALCRHTIDT